MLTATEYRLKESSAKPVPVKSTSVTTKPMEQKKSPETPIKCDINGCKKQCKDKNALKAHKLVKHRNNTSNSTKPLTK